MMTMAENAVSERMREPLRRCLARLALEGMQLELVKPLGKSAFLVTGGSESYVLKLPVAPKNLGQRLAAWVFGGNLKFRREADFYRNLGSGEGFRTLPLVKTDGRTFLLFGYLPGARALWGAEPFDSAEFLQAVIGFQTARVPCGRSALETWALQMYFGVTAQVLRFSAKIGKRAGYFSFFKAAGIVVASLFRQRRNRFEINSHNDILYNVISDGRGNSYVFDFEEVTREGRWFLVDAVEPAFRKSDCGLDWPLVRDYLDLLRSTGKIRVPVNVYVQLRIALLFRVTHAIVSGTTTELEREILTRFYRTTLLSGEGYRAWFAENTETAVAPEVVVTVPDLDMPGGVANYFRALQPHLSSRVRYITRGRRLTDGNGVGRMLADYGRFVGAVRRADCRVVQINTSFGVRGVLRDGVFIVLAKLFRKRVVLFFRGWDHACVRKMERSWLWLFRAVFFRCDCFIVLGKDFAEALRRWGWSGRILRETTVVDETLVAGLRAEDVEARATANRDAVRLLFLGRLEKAKGVHAILDAVRLLRERGVACSATIAGSGSELAALRQRVAAEEIHGVSVPGQIQGEMKREAFLGADIFVLPTRHGEGMPNSVLEAMAMGLPVVTTPSGGIKDFFEDERMGFLMKDPTPAAIAECVERIWREENLRRRMSARNFAFAQQQFLAPTVALRLEKVWDEVLADGASPGGVWAAERL